MSARALLLHLVPFLAGVAWLALGNAAAAQGRGGDRDVGLQRKTRPTGSLRELLPLQNGRFALVDAVAYPEALTHGATDGLAARYRADDGAELTLYLMAFPSPRASQGTFDSLTESLLGEDYRKDREGDVTGEAGETRGSVLILEREREIVVWTNANLLSAAEAADGLAWEFVKTYPY